MTRLVWDKPGERRFETGCDRGVLYLSDNSGVPWNGLTSVDEDFSDVSTEEYYLDGVKYLNRRVVGDYSGTLKALTYPDEFLPYDGVQAYDPGLYVTGQQVNKTFGLSYRTKIGNDLSGIDLGYKIHLLYNLTAVPDNQSYASQGATTSPEEFSWKLSGVPVQIPGYRPAVHIVINSVSLSSSILAIEDYLYGTRDTAPQLPDPSFLSTLARDLITDLIEEPL